MKGFFRTVAGKTLLFMACIFLVILGGLSAVGAYVMITEPEIGIYTRSEEEVVEELAAESYRWEAYEILCAVLGHGEAPNLSGVEAFRVLDDQGNAVSASAGAAGVENWNDVSFLVRMSGENMEIVWDTADVSVSRNYIEVETDAAADTDEDVFHRYTVELKLRPNSAQMTEYQLITLVIHWAFLLRYAIYFIGVACFLLAILSYVALMTVSGHRREDEEIHAGVLTRVPYEVLIGGCCFVGFVCCWFVFEVMSGDNILEFVGACMILLLAMVMFLGLSMSAATRAKLQIFWKTTLVYLCFRLCRRILGMAGRLVGRIHRFNLSLLRDLHLVRITALGVGLLTCLEFFVLVMTQYEFDNLLILWMLEKLVLIPAILYLAVSMRRLQAAGRALAEGDLSYVTDTHRMIGAFREHGENLNSIADGMSIAVEDRLKSERMKTELITNVSHDLKTPLTSVINYADLISREPCENEKIKEYSEVLVRQSDRLKRLIEDLVEASRASTGNLEVHLAPCDAAVFLDQAGGEYEEKLKRAELTLVTKLPEQEIRILADGRRMWRIFDNLMNNICKYAQCGTRVYLSLQEIGGNAVITFKNTSRDELDMSEEELMERFTRGDSSRHTEGNGLGLSIARSMAELQNGTLHLEIDGDLFKAVLTFPVLRR